MNKNRVPRRAHRQDWGIYARILACIGIAAISLYAYIVKQNDVTELRIQIPHAAKQLKALQEENIRLDYEIDRFESPIHLLELSKKPEFSHLKHPYLKDILVLPEPPALYGEEAIEPRKAGEL